MDINADLGEGYPFDAELMPHITSANIACGGHAGDPATMRESLRLTAINEVMAGAHPSFPDRVGFGRRMMDLSPVEIRALVREQIENLKEVAAQVGVPIRYAKPHGALYHSAANDPDIARAIAEGVASAGVKIFYGMAGSVMLLEAQAAGLRIVAEGFADRRYLPSGTLLSREQAESVLAVRESVGQGVLIATQENAFANNGDRVIVRAETLCIHSDTPSSPEIARDLRNQLYENGVRVVAPSL